MSPLDRLWDSVAAPCRAGDLHECVRITRLQVDEHPHELAPRFLLASFYIALRQPGLALLQYERLLPLAVGRGELFLALAAQRRLDELSPQARLHTRRYHAMHQWFVSLARSERKRRGAGGVRAFGPHVLMRLPAPEFATAAERCAVEAFGTESRELHPESGLLWVVLHGRVRWTVSREGADDVTNTAGPGELIVLTHVEGVRLLIEPETPAECLRLEPELFTQVADDPAALVPVADAAIEEQVADLVAAAGVGTEAPPEPVAPEPPPEAAPAESTPAPEAPAPAPRRPRRPGPAPDPVGEPTIAVGAPIERRRETRLSVSVANKVALLGLAGTRVAPLPGALIELSADGMRVRFRSGDLHQLRHRLVGSLIGVHMTLPGAEGAVRAAARVVDATPPSGGDPESEMRVGLEFLVLFPALRRRLERLVAEAA